MNFYGSTSIPRVTLNVTPYAPGAHDCIMRGYITSGVALVVNLPAASGAGGRIYYFKAKGLQPGTLTINAHAGDTIDDASSLVLNTNNGKAVLVCDGVSIWDQVV
jgi:hypothetical protein